MNIVIHPQYQHLCSFLESLPQTFGKEGVSIYKGRNEIKVFPTLIGDVAVKSFKVPALFNRLIYTFFRASKAKRSYEHSLLLKAKGIETPVPVAYMEEKKYFLLASSYYVSTYLDYSGILRELAYHPLEEVEDLVVAFARFTAFLHANGVLHLDYSPGNILYKKTGDEYHFAILDTNRMKFGAVDWETGCNNLRRLWGSQETIARIAREYALARGFDERRTEVLTLEKHAQFWKRHARRHKGVKPYKIEQQDK
ncbi:MAG: tyrosine protein kinase [Candidatus Symbiothrix sp.]|jgi:aminoglycoside phosphotransferase (APT) family kinase protein|nr:tyrosine protein kinase [Candidatus Symbiothrix sp.]